MTVPRHVADSSFATVWFRGHPYPVSAYPSSTLSAGSWWYVLLDDGLWYRVRPRRDGEGGGAEGGWNDVEADISTWLAENLASPPAAAALGARLAYQPRPPRDRTVRVRPLAFAAGCDAADFIRRLNVLFDGRTTRLIVPSMPMAIYGPAIIDPEAAVTLHAGRGALALATYVGLAFPTPGEEVEASSLTDVGVIFGDVTAPPAPPAFSQR